MNIDNVEDDDDEICWTPMSNIPDEDTLLWGNEVKRFLLK